MLHSKRRLSLGIRNKSASLLTLNEIDALGKSSDWQKNYIIRQKEIGRGHFSKVYHVSCKLRGLSFAAKVIRRRKGGVDRLEKIKEEAAIIRKLNELGVHSIIQLIETYENFREVVLISELAKGGSLFKLVQEFDTGLRPAYVKIVTFKLLSALQSMHNENIVHLDIKADNILLREPYPSTNIALCDFGLATQLTAGKVHKELVGTPDYMAPEVINYEQISLNADMWSVGVVVYYLLAAQSPFMGKSKDETLVNVSKAKIAFDSIFRGDEYVDAADFVSSVCVRCPESRLSSSSAQQHRWFLDLQDVDLVPENDLVGICGTTNMSNGVYVLEEEEDSEMRQITPLSRSQRCQSVILSSSEMSSIIAINGPFTFSTTSCEDIFATVTDGDHTDGKVCTKLANVDELSDSEKQQCCKAMLDAELMESNVARAGSPCSGDHLNILIDKRYPITTKVSQSSTSDADSCELYLDSYDNVPSAECTERGVDGSLSMAADKDYRINLWLKISNLCNIC